MGDNDGWKIISREKHFANRNIEVTTALVQTPARSKPRSWTIVRRKPAVVIAATTHDGKFVLIRQERIAIHSAIWEMPAGQIDDAATTQKEIEAVALRELREETGYELAQNGELIALGDFFSSPGFTDERAYFFLARPVRLHAHGHAHDESEAILDCQAFSPAEIGRMIAKNEICDANTLSICARMVARGLLAFERETTR